VPTRSQPLTEKQQSFVTNVPPEFNETKHELGIVSMARGDDPGSAQTSFFICTGPAASLDGKYTVFGHVVDGLAVVQAIDKVERNGEEPVTRVEITKVRLEQLP
jgi:cyclophilin family peptidyl-prolyl cis-trans isomerase